MRQKIVIANIKMNLSVPENSVLFEKYKKEIASERTEVVVCPSYLDIYSAEGIFKGTKIKVGSQDIFYEEEGRYTGEISPDQLKGFAEYSIVGHSERRSNFGETDKIVAKKAAAAARHGIVPIICVGENLHEKMDGLTKLVVTGQTEASLSELTAKEVAESVIAYEPIWAIGTGHTCDPGTANEVVRNIRNLIKVLFGEKTAEKVHIIYGGSIDEKNIKGFAKEKEIDGYLVGTASLNHTAFAKIVDTVDKGSVGKITRKVSKPKSKTKTKKKTTKKKK
ncbi:MAG: triose-phosphate isomerase [Patescibacteria group bacterium]|nr:triose-phosphate isomerase [Patescibacteria group bacterium]